MKQFCSSIEECCFDSTGNCIYCDRKEGRRVRPRAEESKLPSEVLDGEEDKYADDSRFEERRH